MKNKPLFLILIIVGLFFTALLTQNSDIILIGIFFIVYLFAGIVTAPSAEQIKLTAERICEKVNKENTFSIGVTVTIQNSGRKNICIMVRDPHLRGMNITGGNLDLVAAVRPGGKTGLDYSFESARGIFTWDKLAVKIGDPFGCFLTGAVISAPAEIRVQPQYVKFRAFNTHPWKTLSSPGLMETRMSGSSTDFHGVREYRPGDPLRTLCWKLTAKHPHRFFTKEFVQERNADIAVIVDGRRNMEFVRGNESIFELEVKLAAALAEMFIRQGNRTGLLIIGPKPVYVRPGYGKKQLNRILGCLAAANVENDSYSLSDLSNVLVRQYSEKTQFFFLSPFNYNDVSLYRKLRFLGYQILLICPDMLDFAYSESDMADNTAFRISRLERRLYLDLLGQLSISVIDWRVREPIQPLLKNALRRPVRIKRL